MEALIIIDVQNGLVRKDLYNKELFIATVNKAIEVNRKNNNLIIFVQHNSKLLENGTNNWEICTRLNQSEKDIVIQKQHGDAFKKTNLKNILNENNISTITICGLVSHGCVLYSCKGGIKSGFSVKLIKNGHTNWSNEAEKKIIDVENELQNLGVTILNLK